MTFSKRLRRTIRVWWAGLPGDMAVALVASLFILLLGSAPYAALVGLGAVTAFLVEHYRGEHGQRLFRRAEVTVPLVIFVVALFLARDVVGPLIFFRVSAQVIVILVLAIVLQTRIFDVTRRSGHGAAMAVMLFVLLIVGELDSLRALILETRTEADAAIAAIAAGLAGILVGAIAAPWSRDPG